MSNYFDDMLARVGEDIAGAKPIDFSRPLGESVPYIPEQASPELYGSPSPEFSTEVTSGRTNYIPNVFTGQKGNSSLESSNFGGAGSVRQGATGIERIGIDLAPLWAALSTQGIQTTLGLLKAIPGNPVGTAFAAVGESLVGKAWNFLGEAIAAPFNSAGFLKDAPVVGGKNVWDEMLQGKNPWDTIVNNFEVSKGHIGAVLDIGATALAAFGGPGGLALKTAAKGGLGRFVAGAANPFRGSNGKSVLEWFVAPMTRPIFEEAAKRELATDAGRMFGRFALGAQGAGLAIGAGLRATQDPTSWAVKEVANNRLVPEGNVWEMPLELALGLPLDIFGAAKLTSSLARGSSLAGKMSKSLGVINPIDTILPGWAQAVANGSVKREAVEWFYRRGIRDAAMNNLMDHANLEIVQRNLALIKLHTGADLLPLIQHPWEMHLGKQSSWDNVVRKEMGRIMGLGAQERNEMLESVWLGRGVPGTADHIRGWELIDEVAPTARVNQLNDYYKVARALDTTLSGKMIRVDYKDMERQARLAAEYLRGGDVEVGGRASSIKSTPPPAPDTTRLYRGESSRPAAGSVGGRRYTDDPTTAAGIARGGTLYYVDVATSELGLYRSGSMGRGEIFDLEPSLAKARAAYEGFLPGETAGRYTSRTGKIADPGEKATGLKAKFTGTEEEIRTFEDRFPAFKDVYVRGADPETTILRIESLMGKMDDVPEPVKLGRLKNVLDDLERTLTKAGKNPSAETIAKRDLVRKEIEEIHGRVADGYKEAADLARKELDDRINYLASLEGEAADDAWGVGKYMIDDTIDKLRSKISDLRIQEFEARYISGSRYLLGKQLDAPFQRVFDDVADTATMPAGRGGFNVKVGGRDVRISLGELYDKLFGALPQTQVSRAAYESFTDNLRAKGLTNTQVHDVLTDMHDEIEASVKVFGTGARVQKYASVFNLPQGTVNRIIGTRAGKGVAEATNWHEVMYRSYPGPLKIFQEQVFGGALKIPYNKHAVEIARTYMPMWRFYLSPRFILMNMWEPQFFDAFMRGGGKIRDTDMDRVMALHAQLGRARMDYESGESLLKSIPTMKAVSKLTFSTGDDKMADAVLETLYKSETNKDFLREMGIKNETQFLKAVREAVEENRNIIAGSVDDSAPEYALRKQIDELKKELEGRVDGATTTLTARLEIEARETTLRNMVIERHAKAEIRLQKIPDAMKPFIELWETAFKQRAEDAREVIMGNPRRSVAERAANSFLLYWPISYQIKATRALFEFMTSRGFGYKTNLAPAQAVAHMQEWHKEQLETDPEYHAFFKNNRQALFLMQNFVPVTPNEVGTSLGPTFRLPMQVLRGYRKPDEAIEKYGDLGPIYDLNLVQQIVKEQSKKGRLFQDIISQEEK